MLVETPYFGGIINPKTYLNHELDSKFFFLGSLAYKLVKLFVLGEKKSIKMSKNWYFVKIIGLRFNFTYELEVCFKVFSVTFHLVLEVRKWSNFHQFFIWVSARFPSPWIFNSTYQVDLGTLKDMGSLQSISCNWE